MCLQPVHVCLVGELFEATHVTRKLLVAAREVAPFVAADVQEDQVKVEGLSQPRIIRIISVISVISVFSVIRGKSCHNIKHNNTTLL